MPLVSPCIIEGLRQKVKQIGDSDVDLCSFVFRWDLFCNINGLGGAGGSQIVSFKIVQ